MADTRNHLSAGAGSGLGAASLEADRQGATAEEQAVEAEQEQASSINTATLAQSYQSGLANTVQAKYDQVGRIEDRLEGQIEAQETRIQSLASNRPGFLAMPGARQAWEAQQSQQQQVLQKLNERLEAVREIHAGMGVHGPKIEDLAERRFRMREPELAMGWDDMRAAQRGHEALMRKKEQEQRQAKQLHQGHGLSLSRSIGSE